ncbi:hypothetical protein F4778DRAFT_786489 [Xylariomycetidae sp. FL2044]|nr:hypothetical protein F4778DRAFT_786489 [Xylariomycetidae sp. FL2044]
MSGSPPLPPKPNQEVGGRGQGAFQAASQDAYRTSSSMPGGEYRTAPTQPPLPPPPATGLRPYSIENQERIPFSYHRPDEAMGRPISYPPPPRHMVPQPQYALPPVARPAYGQSPYPLTTNPQAPENQPFTSPKSQRKTKGHVASACVPCKRAHLRCDVLRPRELGGNVSCAGEYAVMVAITKYQERVTPGSLTSKPQRPCSRCLSTGKEDACVDVQHKKRGRPRLRDDRDARFDTARFSHPTEPTIRRPLSLYSPAGAAATPYDDALRRTQSQSYRVLKSQPSEPLAPRYLERGSAADANIFPAPLSIPPRAPEPIAFLTLDLEVVKASSTFVEAIGIQFILGRNLMDVVSPPERDRTIALQRSLQDEQGRKEPNYLPPIFGKQEAERVINALPFSPESISRFQLDRQDFFTFVSADGQPRTYHIRVGLAKEDSIYFVVMSLAPPSRPFPHPSPSPHARDLSYSFQPQTFTQLTPVSASFDPGRSRFGEAPRESSYTPRQPGTPAQLISGPSPGMSPNVPSYAASTAVRPDHPAGPSHQIPRSELAASRMPPQTEYQLPPIRSQQQSIPTTAEPSWPRDERTGRVDIGGLIDQPPPRRRGP